MTRHENDYAAFHVPWSTHALAGFVHRFRRLWIGLGNLETWSLAESLAKIAIDRPIYLAGIARSGSTILLEALAAHPDAATHKYKDFPCVFTPCWWDGAQRNSAPSAARERAHADGITVTPDSPEAMEEMLWMAFFRQLHDPRGGNVLDAAAAHPRFESFYRDHIRKLLLVRRGKRYLSKGNYNLTRLQYLRKLFPDARFIVPVRRPESHVASLLKQHRLFCQGEERHPRALEYMRRVGHYEFGLDRRPICAGDPCVTQSIVDLWRQGEEIRGWARSWAHVYGWLASELGRDERLRESTLVVRYEDFCESPAETLGRILAHAELDAAPQVMAFADRIQAPGYYRPDFSPDDLDVIAEETATVARQFGYAFAAAETAPRLAAVD